ncbi:MAG: cell wall hydrolase [Pseudoxanthomonas suwonensis]|nr:MAG: cell wall hydrolase [Pseudoxanthomonas suwonensis]
MRAALIAAALAATAAPAFANVSKSEMECIARTVYHEARGEPVSGQIAVAEVIINRKMSGSFPKNACSVVSQKGQFAPAGKVRESGAMERARRAARAAAGPGDVTNGATYFHTPAVRPGWSRRFRVTARIGSHIFYRPPR